MRRPRFIAEQARNARGPVGRLVAFIMARETWAVNLRAIAALEIGQTDRVLDVGCGHGRSLGAMAELARKGEIVGADPSELMAEIAVAKNRSLVKANRVRVVIADAAALPFADASFDKAVCVHVLYFWDDLRASLREIARVLKPGGRLALVFRSSQHRKAVEAFPADVYRFPSLSEVCAVLREVGFTIEGDADRYEASVTPHLLVAVRSQFSDQ